MANQVKCPGWHHEYNPDVCDVDKLKVKPWLDARQETTVGQRDKQREKKHIDAGLTSPEVEN